LLEQIHRVDESTRIWSRVGDWVEARADVQKVGKRVVFANCYLSVDGERIVRASAVFSRVDGD
jgi:acyl-coenzyme A thioesterase PaaI-like protein